jgi:hypothetical protein
MKTYNSFVVVVLLCLAACNPLGFESTPNLNTDGTPSGTYTITLENGTIIFACNSKTYQLNAGNTLKNAGSVNVANDNEFLYVTVNSTYGFQNVSEN